MALGILGSTEGSHEGSSSTSSMSWSYTVPSGSNRHAVIQLARGYDDATSDAFPASITVGGQTISRTFKNINAAAFLGECSSYLMTESDIAAMSGTTFSVTFANTIDSATSIRYSVVVVEDSNQTLVDSDQVSAYAGGSPMSVTVTSSSGDLVLVVGGSRADSTLGTQTGWTNIAGASNADDTTGSEHCQVRADYIIASGSTTDAEMTFTTNELQAMSVFVFAEDVGGTPTNVNATTDALSLTENAATISLHVDVSAGVDALSLTENAATVNAETNVQAGVDGLTLATFGAGIALDVDVSAGVDALTLTGLSAAVSLHVSVSAGLDALTLTEASATINVDRYVSAAVDALTLATLAATVTSGPAVDHDHDTEVYVRSSRGRVNGRMPVAETYVRTPRGEILA